jgi:hypothetical protein
MTDHKTSTSPSQSNDNVVQPEPPASRKHAPKFEIDFSANSDDNVPDNPFAFAPGHLHKLAVARSATALQAFGGLAGLAYGLRTEATSGLSLYISINGNVSCRVGMLYRKLCIVLQYSTLQYSQIVT